MNHAHSTTTKRRERPVLRLIGTKDLSHNGWLAVRKTGIGSSDAAVGLNPYKSQLELWLEKTGRDTLLPQDRSARRGEPDFLGQHPRTHRGHPLHATHRPPGAANQCGAAALRSPTGVDACQYRPRGDRNNEVQILDCKTAGINGAPLWKEGVPVNCARPRALIRPPWMPLLVWVLPMAHSRTAKTKAPPSSMSSFLRALPIHRLRPSHGVLGQRHQPSPTNLVPRFPPYCASAPKHAIHPRTRATPTRAALCLSAPPIQPVRNQHHAHSHPQCQPNHPYRR